MTNKYLIIALRLAIAGIFIFSASTKLIAPELFVNVLLRQGIFSDRFVAAIFSRVLIGGELAIGLLFLQPFYLRKLIIPITIFLLIGFSAQLAYLLGTGGHDDCGCFGGVITLTPISSLLKNLFILVLVGVLYINGLSRNEKLFIPVALIIASFTGTVLAAPIHLRTDSLFSRYTNFVGEGKVDLTHGMKLVAIFNVDCKHCQSVAMELRSLQKELSNFPKIYVLFYSEGNGSVESFNAASNTNFPSHSIDADEFYTLIGTAPPLVYLINEGEIHQYLDYNIASHLRKIIEQ